jgi:HNH endonuclease
MNGKMWTAADEWMIRAFYPHVSTKELAARLGHPVCSTYGRAKKMQVRKSRFYLDSPAACRLRRGDNVGAASRFKKGIVPANKGLRRPGYSHGRGRMRETQFRKGQAPHNTMPLWTFRFNSDGYLLLKTGRPAPKPNDGWEYVHRLVWEHANGPLPNFRVARIWWKDGDRSNCALSNLELVTAQEHMRRTTIHNFPAPLRAVIHLKGALKRRIRRMVNDAEKHDGRFTQSSVLDDRSIAG